MLTEIPRSIPASVSLCSARASRSLRDSERREDDDDKEEEGELIAPRLAHPAATARSTSAGHAAAARAAKARAAASTASARAAAPAPRAKSRGPGAHAAQMTTAGKEAAAAAASGTRREAALVEEDMQRRHCLGVVAGTCFFLNGKRGVRDCECLFFWRFNCIERE